MVAKKPGALLCAVNSLATNKSHSSLGPNLKPGRIASARRTFERLLTYGIRPDETVVDYGCGTLRLGAFFIDYLDPALYRARHRSAHSRRGAGPARRRTSLKPSARPSRSSAKKAWHAWRQESRAWFARRGCSTCRLKSWTSILPASLLSSMPGPPACCFRISGHKADECRSRLRHDRLHATAEDH